MKQVTPIILTLLLILSLGSCCKDKIKVEKQTQIVMGAASTNGTKGIVSTKEDLVTLTQANNNIPGFGVFGYKTTTSASPLRIFTNREVEPSVTGTGQNAVTSWTYSPIRYWDSNPTVTYQFIAYWPWVGTTVGNAPYVSETGKLLTINKIPNWQDSVPALDFMTSVKMGQYRSTSGTPAFETGIVSFEFKHLLAKFKIKGYYIGDVDSHIKVHKITIIGSNLPTSDGTADYTESFNEQTASQAGFGTVTTGNTVQVLLDDSQEGIDLVELDGDNFDDELDNGNTYEPKDICTWLTIPSTGWTSLQLKISFSVGETAAQEITVSDLTIGTGTTEKSKSYVVTLKFDSSAGGIKVEQVGIKDWTAVTNGNDDREVYNW